MKQHPAVIKVRDSHLEAVVKIVWSAQRTWEYLSRRMVLSHMSVDTVRKMMMISGER
jgi:hypothetical protein